jgi:hypothetical protein
LDERIFKPFFSATQLNHLYANGNPIVCNDRRNYWLYKAFWNWEDRIIRERVFIQCANPNWNEFWDKNNFMKCKPSTIPPLITTNQTDIITTISPDSSVLLQSNINITLIFYFLTFLILN